jgi:hypothetical protein
VKRSPGAKEARSTAKAGRKESGLIESSSDAKLLGRQLPAKNPGRLVKAYLPVEKFGG